MFTRRTLIIDNYDSFTWNLAQSVAAITGCEPIVVRNDELTWEELTALDFANVILSPGPGTPESARDFGICRRVIEETGQPVLGVCLGHQGLCAAFGAHVVPAREPMHGRLSTIHHSGDALFRGVPDGFAAVRYHSLIVEDLPDCLERIAWTENGELMAVRHRERPLWGVQFHPESVCTEYGQTILRNFLELAARPRSISMRSWTPGDDVPALFRKMFAAERYAFWLDSAGGDFSYMGAGAEVFEGPGVHEELARDFAQHHAQLDTRWPFPFQGGWVGYFGYESQAHRSALPDVCFIRVDRFAVIDHRAGTLWLIDCVERVETTVREGPAGRAGPFAFAISKPEYMAKIGVALDAIRAGESYEVCLTNQLRGSCEADLLAYYERLRKLNPAPYGAFLRHPDFQVACSSPELFLKVTADGHVTSKPVKGTAALSANPAELAADEKTRAENLMIVDLVRNDLGRVCRAGSVEVTSLMSIESFATVHQMVSTIEGDLKPGLNALDCIRAAFPPGSMTGAPKLRTMEIIDRLETQARGIYSGCLGFLSVTGAAEFNVVIRSAVFANGEVTIGTGGAIVAQSNPEREWEELALKAEVLVRAFDS